MMDAPTPDSLRPGDLVGPWRIEGYAGRGTYGVVFKARRAGHPASLPVAIKVALYPYDPRFLREVELLSRIRHPSVPELLDRGWWHSGEGCIHPYVVMEWINGSPLYEWARVHDPSSRQVLHVLAQVAWGLEVLHRAEGLHRDVKGDNILVEPEGRAFLTDFGSGSWRGAPPITDRLMPPGTREYRGPEALRFQWHHLRQKDVHYQASTYDDLYALGVTAYRLVTGVYPPPGTDPEARVDPIRVPPPPREPPRVLNPRVIPELSALIERMLAAEPEARGLARKIGEAAEIAAEHVGPEADVPLRGSVQAPARIVAVPVRVSGELEAPPASSRVVPVQVPKARGYRERARPLVVVGSVVLVTGSIWWMGHGSHPQIRVSAQPEELNEHWAKEDEKASLADASVPASVSAQVSGNEPGVIGLQVPDEPFDWQMHAPCRRRGAITINGGCWIPWLNLSPPCGEGAYEWKGACYWPIPESGRVPTSKKPH